MRALAKNPDNRYQTAEEFCQDLERLRQGMPVSATPLLPPAETHVVRRNPVTATRVQSPTSVLPPEERGQRWPWILIGFLVLLGVLIGLFFIGRSLLTENANQVNVPKLVGRSLDEAETKLQEANLKWSVERRVDTSVDEDTVIAQTPEAGAQLQEGSTVQLVVARGEPPVEVPDLTSPGLTEGEAQSALEDVNLKLGSVSTEPSDTVEVGLVISQDPPPGEKVEAGTSVDIIVSEGVEQVEVPDLLCQPLGQAEAHLENEGLTLGQSGDTNFVDACPHSGRVSAQVPAAGSLVDPGTTVTVDETEDAPDEAPPSP
jgi:serine/threonine-protein kinase